MCSKILHLPDKWLTPCLRFGGELFARMYSPNLQSTVKKIDHFVLCQGSPQLVLLSDFVYKACITVKLSLLNSLFHELNSKPKFELSDHKDKDHDIAFYTGFPNYDTLLLCYDLLKEKAEHLCYQNRDETEYHPAEYNKPGVPFTRYFSSSAAQPTLQYCYSAIFRGFGKLCAGNILFCKHYCHVTFLLLWRHLETRPLNPPQHALRLPTRPTPPLNVKMANIKVTD